jgi:hypothetical protein
MAHRIPVRSISLGLVVLGLVACRESAKTATCGQSRLWKDSLGTTAERERIELQWARVAGTWDSLMSSHDGKAKQERAGASLEANVRRYLDSLQADEGLLEFRSGCVDWSATWGAGDFDRMAMATAMARIAAPDSQTVGIGLETDTASAPRWIQVELLVPASGEAGRVRLVRFRLDSLTARLDSAKG